MTDSHTPSPLHEWSPHISGAEEIPFDPARKDAGILRLEIDFDQEDMARLGARSPRGPLIRFIKQAALERADLEAKRNAAADSAAAD